MSSALFNDPRYIEVNSIKSTLFVTSYKNPDLLRIIDLITDEVTTMAINFGIEIYDMKLLGDSMLYMTNATKVISVNSDFDVNAIAGGPSAGAITGPFEVTMFNEVGGLYPWPDDSEEILLVADQDNKRFDSFLSAIKYAFFSIDLPDYRLTACIPTIASIFNNNRD